MDRVIIVPQEFFTRNEPLVVPDTFEPQNTIVESATSGFFWSAGAAAFALLVYALAHTNRR